MTSPVAVVGLTYDATDVQLADLSIFLQIRSGLYEPPNVRGEDTTVPALAGRVEGSRINDTLPIILAGWIVADADETTTAGAQASFTAKARAIRTLFATNRARANLVATLPGGVTATIAARPLNAIWVQRIEGIWAEVNIELEGFDDWVFTEPGS